MSEERPPENPEDLDPYQAFASTESPAPPPNRLGYRSRSERRTYRRAARLRKSHARLWLVVAPVLVVIAVIVVLLTLLGGPEKEPGPTTTLAPAKVYPGGLLVLEQGETVPAVLLLQAREGGGLVLAMPGITLLNTPSDGFKTLAELCAAGDDSDPAEVVGNALGVRPVATASVGWPELRSALASAGIANLPGETLTSGDGENEQVAGAVLASLGAEGPGGRALWDGLALAGDTGGFREALGEIASTVAGGAWVAAELGGRHVESTGGEYLEPDIDRAKAVLAGKAEDQMFTLQVQNGSGVVGIAEQTVELLAPMGYTMLPVGNAEDFPDVEQTRITASGDAVDEARRVRSFLGVGTVTEDATLEPGHMIVVLGKDYVPPTTATQPTG